MALKAKPTLVQRQARRVYANILKYSEIEGYRDIGKTALALGISTATLNRREKSPEGFKLDELLHFAAKLNIPISDLFS